MIRGCDAAVFGETDVGGGVNMQHLLAFVDEGLP
jgi:hypothetical protein